MAHHALYYYNTAKNNLYSYFVGRIIDGSFSVEMAADFCMLSKSYSTPCEVLEIHTVCPQEGAFYGN
jgi:hypothetical protein